MKIWIDIVNSPHVLFFQPIIDELHRQKHSVVVTAREYAQTKSLLHKFNISHTLIGAHAGANVSKKIIDVFERANKLIHFVKGQKIDCAITFNSPSLALAARYLRLPSMVFMDYEYQPLNYLTFRLARKVVVPEIFPSDLLKKFGAIKKTIRYAGLKEQIYLSNFKPDPNFPERIGIDRNKIIITGRPPPTGALYHRFENKLFYELINFLSRFPNVVIIVVPRSLEQQSVFCKMRQQNLLIPEQVFDGRNLVYHSDLVISAGGTMNREAAILGVPAYSVFKGKIGVADRYLIEKGRIIMIEGVEDFAKIKITKKPPPEPILNPKLIKTIVALFCK